MDEHSSHQADASSEPGGADEIRAARGAHDSGAGTTGIPEGGEGVALGAGAPSTFEPEEDPAVLPDGDGSETP